MRKIAIARSALAAAMVLALSAGTAMAVTGESTAAFESEGMLHFQPGFEATGYTLKVAGPGNFHRELLFTDEDVLGVPVKSLGQLDDGLYNYEITPIRGFGKRSDERAGIVAESPRSEVTSGVFRVVEGKVVMPDTKTPEPAFIADDRDNASLAKDVVHLDDVIVDGSLCVGFDCVNGENFGFDTIRLKENNLRVKFDDTSNSGSFPFVDWQLTANDSANGGANKFSIDDITNSKTPFTVEANAPTNSLYVDDGGRLGLGTSTPSVNIHAVNGNTPTLRLEQNGSSGFAAQTWDVAGNETNFFIRDVTNGSKLPFRIRPGAPTSSIDIAASGNVGIGTASPAADLHVRGTDQTTTAIIEEASGTEAVRTMLTLRNNGGSRLLFETTANDLNDWLLTANTLGFAISEDFSGVQEFMLQHGTGNLTIAGTLTQNSDRNRKTNITPVDPVEVLRKVVSVPISTWAYKEDSSILHLGPMAQDFYASFGLGEKETTIATIDTSGVALASIQALYQLVNEKDRQIEALISRIEALEKDVAKD